MDNPAGLSDVQNSIERPLTPDEERVIPTWLDRAWRILNREVPGITFRNALDEADPDHLPEDDVLDVVVAMVERKVRTVWNPETLQNDATGRRLRGAGTAPRGEHAGARRGRRRPGVHRVPVHPLPAHRRVRGSREGRRRRVPRRPDRRGAVGRRFIVTWPAAQSDATARRLPVQETR
jgi:hypothetical protein